jgi:hypothetical protein
MLPPPMIRDWARRLITSEVDSDPPSKQTELATVRVYEKLRRQLCAPVGVDGFQALASRALSVAQSQSPRLSVVQITANGGLRGLEELKCQMGTEEDTEIGIILISQLLGLFLTLLGEAATIRLIEGVPTPIAVKARLNTTKTNNGSTGMSYFGPFEGILLEADQLRTVSERLESLADEHADVDELMSVAGSIRNIAAVLDVFTAIRNRAGGAKDSVLHPPTNDFLN